MNNRTNPHSIYRTMSLLLLAITLSGCLEKEETQVVVADSPPPVTNTVPVISGTPATSVHIGTMYSFSPNAADADGDKLTFSIENMPMWASFDNNTGRLSGQPTLGNVGVHGEIQIAVSDGQDSAALAMFSITVDQAPPVNSAPVISGSPATAVNVGDAYSFSPAASDADGDRLVFSIENQPTWASFSTDTGVLSGQPAAGDVGVYSGIGISVSDGQARTSLQQFSINVNAASLASVTISWTAPTENADGSALTDLAGYKIYWGTTSGSYTNSVTVSSPGITSYVVENLSPGTYEFVATSFNSAGVESAYSNPATKVLN